MNRAKIFIAFTFLLAFAIQVSAQEIEFSNELSGFRFYQNLKSKGFELAKSRSVDLKQLFGKDCLSVWDYDENWEIFFTYLQSQTVTENGIEKKYILAPDYANTVWTVEFRPKKSISFLKVKFPDEFSKGGGGISHFDSTLTYYEDVQGLTYAICDNDTKDGKYKKGDLLYIKYTVPKEIEKKALILIQLNNEPIKNH